MNMQKGVGMKVQGRQKTVTTHDLVCSKVNENWVFHAYLYVQTLNLPTI